MRIIVQVAGLRVLDRTLARYQERAADLRPAFNLIADDLAALNRRQFDTQGQSGGQRWAALSPRYRAWKAKHYPGRPILVRTGELRRQLTQRPFGVERITRHTLQVGTDLPYSAFHETGTRHMPARKPTAMTGAARDQLVRTLARYVVEGH